jgi:hypothetical protein
VAFGSFSSSANAQNWAAKLSAMFDHPMQISPIETNGTALYRVTSDELSEQAYTLMARKARASGISYWRISAAQPDVPPGRIDTPLGAARMTPPSPPARQTSTPPDATVAQDKLGVPVVSQPVTTQPATTQPDRTQPLTTVNRSLDWTLGLQSRLFAEEGVYGQDQAEVSLSAELDYFIGWRGDARSVTFTPFMRIDSADSKRTHFDVRELFYSRVADNWDLHIGAKRVFWGVTEFHHLIDIINQTDLVENIDTEDKLGQPMVQWSTVADWGVLDVYALPGFRERTFAGEDGRLRLPFKVLDDADYESGARTRRTDFALRWSHFMGPFEVGVHHFSGTSREPILEPQLAPNGELVLRPYYPVIDQTGIDAQAFYADWALKIEGFTRSGFGDRYAAANIGLERTLVGIMGTRADLGVVAEYMFDERDEEAFNTLFEHDVALGGRFSLNDFADTKALLGVIFDTDNNDYVISLEASRRLGADWLLSLEGRVFAGGQDIDTDTTAAVLLQQRYKSAWLQQDDYLQVEFRKFF